MPKGLEVFLRRGLTGESHRPGDPQIGGSSSAGIGEAVLFDLTRESVTGIHLKIMMQFKNTDKQVPWDGLHFIKSLPRFGYV